MLQLTRKLNESIIIDDTIKVIVLNDKHGPVRLGIEASQEIEIWREGIFEMIQIEN